jgi:hypothetical protein
LSREASNSDLAVSGSGVLGAFLNVCFVFSESAEFLTTSLFEELSVMTYQDSKNIEHNNAYIAYQYTEYHLDVDKKGIESIEKKLTTLLASSGILLRLSMDLSGSTDLLARIKIGICAFIVLSLILCLLGLSPKSIGSVIKPCELIEDKYDRYGLTEEEMRLFITRSRIKASEALGKELNKMKKLLKYAYLCLGVVSILFAINIVLSTMQNMH